MRYFTSRITPNVTGEKHLQLEQGETSDSVGAWYQEWREALGGVFKIYCLEYVGAG